MKRTLTFFLTAVAICILLPNCATIVSKTRYPVLINCNPTGTQIEIVDRKGLTVFYGETPAAVALKSGSGFFTPATYTLHFSTDGYKPAAITIAARFNGWYIGNIVFGGLLGMLIVDPATGAMWRIDEKVVNMVLSPNNEQVLNVLDVNSLPEEYKDHLIRIN